MNSVPQHLSSEDRQEYERLLDETLRSAPHRPELAAVGRRLSPGQLRAMALSATALITSAAAAEYQHYVEIREALRNPAPSVTSSSARRPAGPAGSGTSSTGPTATTGEAAEAAGPGAGAVITVLALVLTGTAAAIFLLIGCVLQLVAPGQAFARTMLTAGWAFGALTAVAILVAATGLLTTALRNRPSAEAATYGARDGEVQRAREAWRTALLERGIVPFLRDALADPAAGPAGGGTEPSAPSGRMPRLGYGRPGFTSPDGGSAAGPRPDYSSPDFGGPEHRPE